MKDLNLNELLRYFFIGIFLIMLLYISFDETFMKEQLKVLGTGLFGVLSLLSLTLGAIVYVIYRAITYPLIINPLITLSLWKLYKRAFPEIKTSYIRHIDLLRWKSKDERIKNLSEWASQVHFLYNLTFVCGIVWVASYYNSNINLSKWIYILGSLNLIFSIIHHIRYKIRELNLLSENQ
jgi:hypothetical protein